MRNIIAIAAALGFLAAVSTPSFAATTQSTTEFSAAKKVDCKDPKNATNKACVKKMDKKSSLTATVLSAATKKVDCKDPKNAKNKACVKKTDKMDKK
jgi:hypothetical protein